MLIAASLVSISAPSFAVADLDTNWTDQYSCKEIDSMLASLETSYKALKEAEWTNYNLCVLHNDPQSCAARNALLTVLIRVQSDITHLELAKRARC